MVTRVHVAEQARETAGGPPACRFRLTDREGLAMIHLPPGEECIPLGIRGSTLRFKDQ
jgi:hypothetical protein